MIRIPHNQFVPGEAEGADLRQTESHIQLHQLTSQGRCLDEGYSNTEQQKGKHCRKALALEQ